MTNKKRGKKNKKKGKKNNKIMKEKKKKHHIRKDIDMDNILMDTNNCWDLVKNREASCNSIKEREKFISNIFGEEVNKQLKYYSSLPTVRKKKEYLSFLDDRGDDKLAIYLAGQRF